MSLGELQCGTGRPPLPMAHGLAPHTHSEPQAPSPLRVLQAT